MGAMLQAYALNRVLTEMGNDCYFLPFYEHPFLLVETKMNFKDKILAFFRRYKGRQYTNAWFRDFNQFLHNECKFAPYVSFEKLKEIEDQYDLFLVGSDQVWNVSTFNSECCLLKWVSNQKKKFSYAVSLGSYSIRMKNDYVLDAIQNFEHVSFRERIDYEDANRNGVNCRLDLDPTFLLGKEEWAKKVKPQYEFLKKSICVFGYDTKSFDFAKQYAKKMRLNMVVVNYFGNRIFPGIKILNPASPVDLLSIIYYAQCVVTHSYHVFIISLNLNKQVFITKNHGTRKTTNRFDTVLETFALEDRETNFENISKTVDWNNFNTKLQEHRKNSLEYLRGITK